LHGEALLAGDDLPHDIRSRAYWREKQMLACARSFLSENQTGAMPQIGGWQGIFPVVGIPVNRPKLKSQKAKWSKLAGQLAAANMVGKIEQHAGATCA
jgi:hypothetical protein